MLTSTAATAGLPAPVNVEESKAKRQQRLQSRFRDRGGIFVPSEKNTLVDLLLARSVTGESPNKVATSSIPKEKQPPSSPVRAGHDNKSTAKKPSKRKAKVENKVEVEGGEQFEAGPANSRSKSKSMKAVTEDITKRESKPGGRPPKANVDAQNANDTPAQAPDPLKPKGTNKKRKLTTHDETTLLTHKSKPTKRRKMTAESDREEEPSRSKTTNTMCTTTASRRTKRKLADLSGRDEPAKRATSTTAKERPVKVKPVTIDLDSDDSAVVIPVKRKKVAHGGTKRESSKSDQSIEDDDSGSHDDENTAQPLAVLKAKCMSRRPEAIATPPVDEEGDSDEDLIRPAPKTKSRKHILANAAAPRHGDEDSGENITKPARKAARSKIAIALDDDGSSDEDLAKPVQKAKARKPANTKPTREDICSGHSDGATTTLIQKSKTKRATKTEQKPVQQRAHEPDYERSKQDLRLKPDKGASVANAKTNSTTLKENTVLQNFKSRGASKKRTKSSNTQPARKGPPQEVINQMKARARVPPSSPHTDTDSDPIDFLS